MPKSYKIVDVIKKEGVIQSIVTKGGMVKTKEEVIQNINDGYSVTALDRHGHEAEVINVKNEYVRTVPTKNNCDNLGNL